MPPRRASVPRIKPPRARGIATRAWEKFVGSSGQGVTPSDLSRLSGSRFTGFGTPGAGRQIRELSVEEQLEIIGRYRGRDLAAMRPRTARGLAAVSQGDDSILFTVNLRDRSTNPDRPRAEAAGYDSKTGTVRVRFRRGQPRYPNGAIYEYYGVPRSVWKNFLRASSPGRFIDRVLDTYPYTQVSDTWEPQNVFSNQQRGGPAGP